MTPTGLPVRQNPFASMCGRICGRALRDQVYARKTWALIRRGPVAIRARSKRFATEQYGVENLKDLQKTLFVLECPWIVDNRFATARRSR